LERIIFLDQKEMTYSWSKLQWDEFLASNNPYLFLTYSSNDIIVSFCLFLLNPFDQSSHLLKISTCKDSQGLGIASKLLEASATWLKSKGFEQMFLEVETQNESARALYAKSQFVILNKIKAFYSDGADAISMHRKLLP
jgi:ribosomal-protein-alanine N-acetyltransferase